MVRTKYILMDGDDVAALGTHYFDCEPQLRQNIVLTAKFEHKLNLEIVDKYRFIGLW